METFLKKVTLHENMTVKDIFYLSTRQQRNLM